MTDLPNCYRCEKQPCECADGITLYHGDCRDILPLLKPRSVDLVCTDPPYGLGFMGKEFDTFKPAVVERQMLRDTRSQKRRNLYAGRESDAPSAAMAAGRYDFSLTGNQAFQQWCTEMFAAILPACKPGAMLASFGGTRTYHRLTCAIEDAGWEVRDCMMWLFGSGFPKSLDVSKAIDKAAGVEREVVGSRRADDIRGGNMHACNRGESHIIDLTTPATDAAKLWDGYGTALKPAWESITVAQKPLHAEAERSAIVQYLLTLEAKLWSMLPAPVVTEYFKLSAAEHAAACDIARWTAEERTNTRDALFGQMDMSRFVSVMTTSLSTVSSWRTILGESCEQTKTSTTPTVTEPTIDWEILNSCLSELTPASIIQAELQAPGSRSGALPAARYFNAVVASIASTRELSVVEHAISSEPGKCPGVADLGLSPNFEPIVLAMKPLAGTFAENALEHGVAGLNVDGGRVGTEDMSGQWDREWNENSGELGKRYPQSGRESGKHVPPGRWPANLLLSHVSDTPCPACTGDYPACRLCGGTGVVRGCVRKGTRKVKGIQAPTPSATRPSEYGFGDGYKPIGYADVDGLETVDDYECVESCPVYIIEKQAGSPVGRFFATMVDDGSSSIYNQGVTRTLDGELPCKENAKSVENLSQPVLQMSHEDSDAFVLANVGMLQTKNGGELMHGGRLSETADGIDIGENREVVESTLNSNRDGHGSKQTEQSQKAMKSTTGITTEPTTGSKTLNSSQQRGTETTTSDCEKTIKSPTGSKSDDASGAVSTKHLANSTPEKSALTADTASLVQKNTCENGETKTANMSTHASEHISKPSRVFYCAKASGKDRGNLPAEELPLFGESIPEYRNTHPTCKPTELMQYLLTLLYPPNPDAVCLDPFAGSGTTGVAAKLMGRRCILIELEQEYCDIVKVRLE